MNNLLVYIQFLLPALPRAERTFAESLLENPYAITTMTLAEISSESNCSEASIIRFCKRLGYSGYSQTKEAFKIALDEGLDDEIESIYASDDMSAILEKVHKSKIQILNDTVTLADPSVYQNALDAIINANSIHFFGVGDAYATCLLAYMKFQRLGMLGSAPSDVMQQLTTAASLNKGDVAIAVSYEGRSRNIVSSIRLAQEAGASTICITKMAKSPLLKVSDIALFTAVNDLTVGRDKVTQRIADQFILDALCMGYISKIQKNIPKQLKKIQDAIDENKI